MDAIKKYDTLSCEETVLDPTTYGSIIKHKVEAESLLNEMNKDTLKLPKIQCIVATKSAKAGINGKFL